MVYKNIKATFVVFITCFLSGLLFHASTRAEVVPISTSEAENAPFFLKSRTQSMTEKYFFRLDGGEIFINQLGQRNWKIYTSPLEESDKINGRKIVEISADGENLIAIDQEQQIYYTKIEKVKWQKKWGKPIPKVTKLLENRAWGISHRGPYMGYYDDIHGNRHPILAGVTTLYLLSQNGHQIFYIDPWLPNDWYHEVETPFRGRFVAVNMSVSGSSLFIINSKGEMFTRLYDYDTAGQDPILPYSYKKEIRTGKLSNIRSLPAEDWLRQPDIKTGMITTNITMLQTGEKGNNAFQLRVEGINGQGKTGYFVKKINGAEWSFIETGDVIKGKLIFGDSQSNGQERELSAIKTKNYRGKIWLKKRELPIEIHDCSPIISPAQMVIRADGKEYTFLYHMRRYKYEDQGLAFKSTLQISDEFVKAAMSGEKQNSEASELWNKLFRKEQFIDFHASIEPTAHGLRLDAIENLHQFGADKIADIITWKILYPWTKVLLKAKYHKRLKMSLVQIPQ